MIEPPTKQNFSRNPMLMLAVFFGAGISLGGPGRGLLVPAALCAILIILCVLAKQWKFVVLPLLFVPLGMICSEIERLSVAADRIKTVYADRLIESHEPVEIVGSLYGFPEPAYGGSFITLHVSQLTFREAVQSASGRVRLFVLRHEGDADVDLRHGSVIRVACRLEREDRFLNPGVASRIMMLDQQGIDAVATVKSRLLIEELGTDPVFMPLSWAFELRHHLLQKFREMFSARTAGVMTASLLGDKHFLDRDTAEVFREGGTFHVLVISGLHITFIGAMTLWFVSFFTRRLVWQALLATSFLWAYTFAVGAEVPVVRASIMFSLVLLARLVYRDASLINALGSCSLVLLVWRPSDLFSASFQLTLVSVAAIVCCAFPLIEKLRAIGSWSPTRETPLPPRIGPWLRRPCEFLYWNEGEWRIRSKRNIWTAGLFKFPQVGLLFGQGVKTVAAYLFEGLLVSLIVQVWMLPVVVIYFHRVSPPGLFLNLWVGALLALESFAAVAAVIASAVSIWIAAPLIVLTEVLNTLMLSAPTAVSALQIADIRIPVYPGNAKIIYVLYGCSVAYAAIALLRWQPFSISSPNVVSLRPWIPAGLAIAFGAIIITHPFSSPAADGRLRIDFLDVGQGDAALITFPDGQTMLVDGGGQADYNRGGGPDFESDRPRIGEAVVSEFLWQKGYSRVDYIVATHADADHMQGLVDVARNFSVGVLVLGDDRGNDPDLMGLMAVVDKNRVPVQVVDRGDSFYIAGVDVSVLNPTSDGTSSMKSSNDRSVVLLLKFDDRRFLLSGDIERHAESDVVTAGPVVADVIKVAHHGSRTSSTQIFVDSIQASVAVISVGRRSQFGHPHAEVVERWSARGATVMKTGEKGTITVETDGMGLEIRTFLQ
ncbi:MAG TPA: ComEC/Rec2 family competence protein [Pyrinomonadaceae bacterium]|nr:ComEC/Rec2 family competence protein [Pyrinomonadaceae bacterium]